MKHTKKLYWSVTGLMAAFMLMGAIPDLLKAPLAIAIFAYLGHPVYLLRFLGTAKLLRVITVLAPGVPGLKEWAYAGLVVGAYLLFRQQVTNEGGAREVFVPAHSSRAAARISVA